MTKKRGRPAKGIVEQAVDTPEAVFTPSVDAEPVPENERFEKRPIMSDVNDKITITVGADGRKHIDCGGFNLWDVLMILKGCHNYIFNEFQKQAGMNGSVEEGTADATGGSDT